MPGYHKILAATDFSPPAEAAVRQGVWLAQRAHARLVVAHVLADVTQALLDASAAARAEMVRGEIEVFQREVRRASDERLQQLIAGLPSTGVDVRGETLLG